MQTFKDALFNRPVVIGTPRSVAALAGQLAVTDQLPPLAGCVLAGMTEGDSEIMPEIAGIPVLGTLSTLSSLHADQPFSAALVSFPRSQRSVALKVSAALGALSIPFRMVPVLEDFLGETQGEAMPMRVMPMSELVGRTPHGFDRASVRRVIESKRVLVTGAGGSIGAEICRIVAEFRPSLLAMVERSENALFDVDRMIARRSPQTPRSAALHDVVDAHATLRLVQQVKPHVVFHAAAHKHVPLMEDHPSHAITNNLLGTKSIADAAKAAGAERFVMISTDKAVRPTSAMGATKRLAELYVQHLGRQESRNPGRRTRSSIVRFGNVLGSACSVLPIWSQQLAEGGPLTVTDERMTRFFMTIPEAAMLVIQSAAIDLDDALPRVYVLDMGEPLRILDLAQRFARLHGYEPVVLREGEALAAGDTPTMGIALTGIRPGEKLHEELAYQAEALIPTQHPGILELRSSDAGAIDIDAMVRELSNARNATDNHSVRSAIMRYLTNDGAVQGANAAAA